MKLHPQKIMQRGSPVFVILPNDEYEAILEKLEDMIDVETVREAQTDSSEYLPIDVVNKIADILNVDLDDLIA